MGKTTSQRGNVMIHDSVYVRKAIAGDDEAFDALVKRHRPKIYEVAHKMLGNPRDVESMVHATFSAARKHMKSFQSRAPFGTWVYRITVNQCLQYRYTKARLNVY